MRRLKRKRGLTPNSSHAIAIPWSANPLDPNGYYLVLRVRHHPALMGDIRNAFLDKVKEIHPDTGNFDGDAWEWVMNAWAVLGKYESRLEYDSYREGEFFWDSLKERELTDLMMERFPGRSSVEVVGAVKRAKGDSQQAFGRTEEVMPEEFTYYFFREGDVPSLKERQEWVYRLAYALWLNQRIGPFRIGFARQMGIVDRPWGRVYMVSGPPSFAAASFLVMNLTASERRSTIHESPREVEHPA